MTNKILKTPVDELVELVEKNQNCKISFLVSSLKVPAEILERWLIILEEFKVLKIKYVGFEGYISLTENNNSKNESESNKTLDIDQLKNDFLKKARVKNLPSSKISKLWKLFLQNYEGDIKKLFEDKAKAKGYNNIKINNAWKKYKLELEVL